MSRNFLYLIIGGLAVVAMVLGYQVYQSRQTTSGIQIDIGDGSMSIETN
ncbi:MAG: hypothetical protein WCC57_05815 [Paracoccaceae bacterium]